MSLSNASRWIAVTNRHLCQHAAEGDFITNPKWYTSYLSQIESIAKQQVYAIVLREKDLDTQDYTILAKDCIAICKAYNTKLILHQFLSVAKELHHPYIHLPLPVLIQESTSHRFTDEYSVLGTSTHSVEDARIAQSLGATYIFCGNIYETDCKKGLPGRGLSFLQNVCHAVNIPVYAIGGMNEQRLPDVCAHGATGACMMSGFMRM